MILVFKEHTYYFTKKQTGRLSKEQVKYFADCFGVVWKDPRDGDFYLKVPGVGSGIQIK